MVYNKNYKKKYNSKKKYNNKKTFSRYNTYKYRSAKAQSYQIYKLNKRLTNYIKYNKPETQANEFNAITETQADNYTSVKNQSTDVMMWSVIPPNFFTTLAGKLCRTKKITVRGAISAEYTAQYPSVVRLIFFQNKQAMDGLPLPSEIINYSTGDNTDFEKGPLKTGVTSNYKILKQKNVVLSPSFYRSRTFKIKLPKGYNFRNDNDFKNITVAANIHDQYFPKGSIFCLALFSNQGHEYNGPDTWPAITLKDVRVKIAYVDQN